MSLSPFVVILLPALLVVIGLVVDGGAQAAAANRAERVAAAAARAAADDTSTAEVAGVPANLRHALAQAERVIAAEPGLSGTARREGTQIVVTTTAITPTVLLSLIGIDHLQAHGSARAELISDR